MSCKYTKALKSFKEKEAKFVEETSLLLHIAFPEGYREADQDIVCRQVIEDYFDKENYRNALTTVKGNLNCYGADVRDALQMGFKHYILSFGITKIGAKKYNHAADLGLEVCSDNEEGATNEELIQALERRLNILKNNPEEIQEAFGIFDTHVDGE